ncbi:MAG: peptidase T [Coriobacteriia bacterium]|nr:peptidase T [Coriobacteriia bacterium]
MSDVLERFIRYASIDTQSDPKNAGQTPSSTKQFDLAKVLFEELKELGITDAALDEHAYVTGHLSASEGLEDLPVLGLIAHLDASPDAPSTKVRPHIVSFTGEDIVLEGPKDKPTVISAHEIAEASSLIGKDLVVSDGTTLLSADDKAGVAEIMALIARLVQDPSIAHPRLAIAFVPDEEIGHGASLLDLESFGADIAYTVDGGPIGEIEYENFNAAQLDVRLRGTMVHPGSAKDIMVNACDIAWEFHSMLPAQQRPQHTEGYEGFFHLHDMSGTVDEAHLSYIIRDHSTEEFENKKALARKAAELLALRYGADRIKLEISDSYYNMAHIVKDHMELVEKAKEAFLAAGFTPNIIPIRGGTDGAQLSYRGLPCPNLSTGGYNYHSVREFIPVFALEGMVEVLVQLVEQFAQA